MIEVELPDGSVAEFPDGTPPETIKGAIQKRLGTQPAQPLAASPFGTLRGDVDPAPFIEEARGDRLAGEAAARKQSDIAQYESAPGWAKPLAAGYDIANIVADGATFGFGDKAIAGVGALFGGDYDKELAAKRRDTEASRNRAGWAGTVAEVAGGLKTAGKAMDAGLTLTGRLGTAGMKGVTGLGARSALMGAEGAGYGAASAAGHDTDIGEGAMWGAGAGAAGNVIGEGVAKGIGAIGGAFAKKPNLPTVDDLKAAGKAAFKEADDAGVVFNQTGVRQLKQGIVDDLTARGFDPVNEPGVMPIINRLKALGNGNISFEGLHSLRRVAQNGWRPGMNSNNDALAGIITRIDDLVNKSDPSTVLMGSNPKAAANAFMKAKSQWHRAKKLETVEKAITRGEQNAAAQVSGDVGRTTMGQLKKILQSEGKSRGFTPAEMKKLGSAAGYSTGQRVAHAVGGLMPRGRLLSSIHAATMLGTGGASIPLQAAGATVGYAAQKTAEAISKRSVAELVALIANGGVPPQVQQNLLQRLSATKREALARALTYTAIARTREQAPGQQRNENRNEQGVGPR